MLGEYSNLVDDIIELAIREDIGDGDHTSLSTIPREATGKMKLLVKEDCVIAGIDIAKIIFERLSSDTLFETIACDGDRLKKGDIAFYVKGNIVSLLQAERIVLNIMQRMSGVATNTAKYVKELEGLDCRVLDTRKTTPGMRVLDKLAVKIGGGENHRMGLFDMIMIKDNHVDFAGGITAAVERCCNYLKDRDKEGLKIEVECRTKEDICEAIATKKVDRVMLDNFSPLMAKEAVDMVRSMGSDIEIEISGGVRLDTIREYAVSGANFISIGAVTHQIESVDLSLKACDTNN